jgi:hypothetical protein
VAEAQQPPQNDRNNDNDHEDDENKNKDEEEDDEDYTPMSDYEKEKMYH